ncbi:MAG: glycoside hydrolase family protein [Burkholderiales bacterium]|nr:glycoside hydrolase family protein [Burkholderiales bacterium]
MLHLPRDEERRNAMKEFHCGSLVPGCQWHTRAEEEAEVYLARDLVTALNATLRYCPVLVTEPESRLAAIVDFTFNLGAGRLQTSTLRRRINQRDWPSVVGELKRWVQGGGRVLPGLMYRREAEIQLIFA